MVHPQSNMSLSLKKKGIPTRSSMCEPVVHCVDREMSCDCTWIDVEEPRPQMVGSMGWGRNGEWASHGAI